MTKFLMVDGHEDLAWNMLCFDRDYATLVGDTRAKEKDTEIPSWTGTTLLGWDVFQEARAAIIFSTLFAAPERTKFGDWDKLCYSTIEEAHQLYSAQLDAYHRLIETHASQFRMLHTRADLQTHMQQWRNAEEGEEPPVGMVVLMEAAEGVRSPEELPMWWQRGVRMIGPAWAGTRYCGGTHEPGPLTKAGYALLDGMMETGFMLDISHMDERAVYQALDHYEGVILASHANANALVKRETNRLLTDRMLDGLLERNAVIGVVLWNSFLHAEWKTGDDREMVPLDTVAAQIDYICQKAGDAKHAAIGSDFDGGFGRESVPAGVDTLADLHKLVPLLDAKGYSDADIAGIFGENWLRVLEQGMPESV